MDPESDGVEREPYDPKQAVRILSRLFNIDEFLAARGLRVDEASRIKLIEQVAVALILGAETLKRRARGDYGVDEVAKRFPPWKEKHNGSLNGSQTRLADLLGGWAKESKPAQATVDLWRSHVASFTSYIGNDDARSIQRGDVVKWKQHLIELGNTPKTINDSKLAALKTIFRWGVENEVISQKPATGVTMRRAKKAGEKMLGFEPEEAAVILKVAVKQANPAYRWVPLLCAQSGARVSEICHLRREDIRCEDRIWFMHFRPEAGTMKTVGSERKVPLHPVVEGLGFLDFVNASGSGPLFFDPGKRRAGAKKPQAKIVAKSVARWVHGLGIDVGLRVRKAPNHAWRHFFRTSARGVGIDDTIVDAILGHAATTVGRSYGETRLTTASKAIAAMPLPGVGTRVAPRALRLGPHGRDPGPV